MSVRLLKSLKFILQVLNPGSKGVEGLYTVLGAENSLCEKRRYMNLGYWKTGARDLDAAGDALAALMAETAELMPADEVLDVGFGFADQDIEWVRTVGSKKIIGINIAAAQVEIARQRVAAEGMQDRIELFRASATELPFAEASFDVVFAMESAFHFHTREQFFLEALRVLRPAGRIVLADLTVVPPKNLRSRLLLRSAQRFWQIPAANLQEDSAYIGSIERAGFRNASLQSIWNDVYPGFVRFARERLAQPPVRDRMNPFFHAVLAKRVSGPVQSSPDPMDYVLVSARK